MCRQMLIRTDLTPHPLTVASGHIIKETISSLPWPRYTNVLSYTAKPTRATSTTKEGFAGTALVSDAFGHSIFIATDRHCLVSHQLRKPQPDTRFKGRRATFCEHLKPGITKGHA